MKQRLHVHGIRLDDQVFARRGDHWVEVDSPRTARRLFGSTPTPVLVVPADRELTPNVRDLRAELVRGAWWATLDASACTGRKGLAPDTKAFLYSLPEHQRAAALLSLADGAFLFDDPTAYLRARLDDQLRAELVAALFIWSLQEAKIGRGLDTFYWGRLVEEYLPVPTVSRVDDIVAAARSVASSYVTGAQYAPGGDRETCAVLVGLWLWAGGRIGSKLVKRLPRALRKISGNSAMYLPSYERYAETRKREHLLDVLSVLFGTTVAGRYTPKVELLTVRSADGRLLLEDPEYSGLGSGVAEVSSKDLKAMSATRRAELTPGTQVPVLWQGRFAPSRNRIVSVSLAEKVAAWDTVSAMLNGSGVVDAKVLAVVPGGLRLDVLGLGAFLPGSLVKYEGVPETISDLVGETIPVAPVQLSPRTLGVVVSHREGVERRHAAAADELRTSAVSRFGVGQVFDGTVSSWANFGMFVDLGGFDGLCHISTLDGLAKGDIPLGERVRVEVVEVDRELRRVALRLAA
jgi:hypothetical protein